MFIVSFTNIEFNIVFAAGCLGFNSHFISDVNIAVVVVVVVVVVVAVSEVVDDKQPLLSGFLFSTYLLKEHVLSDFDRKVSNSSNDILLSSFKS